METNSKPLRILMLLENNSYPDDARVRREATCLFNAGYQVTIVCPKEDNRAGKEVVDGIVTYRYYAPASRGGLLGYFIEFGYSLVAMFIISLVILFREGFDVIHAHNPPDILVLIAMFYKPLGKKFVFDHHDLSPELYNARSMEPGKPAIRKILLFFERLTFRFADHVISTNESYANIAMSRGNVSPENISIVRNGPKLERVQQSVKPDPAFSEKATTLIGYLGAMGFQDGLDYFVRAIHHLVHELDVTDFYAVLVGDGDAVESLEDLITELELDDYVHFMGYQPDSVWRPILADVDFCVVPDPSNPFNNRSTMMKITDYMALGKPTVAFDLPEHRVTAGKSALYATPNDEHEFAQLMKTLIEDPERRKKMGRIGKDRLIDHLAWEFQAENLLEAYEKLRTQ